MESFVESSGRHLGGIREPSGRHLGSIREASGRHLGDIWEAYGRLLRAEVTIGGSRVSWRKKSSKPLCFTAFELATPYFA